MHPFQIKTLELIDTIGLTVELTTSQKKNAPIIQQIWRRFNRELHSIPGRISEGARWQKFGITAKEGGLYFYTAAIKKTPEMNSPAHMDEIRIPHGEYVSVLHTGSMNSLPQTIFNIYKHLFPENSMEPAHGYEGGLIQFELYDHRFDWNSPGSVIEIFVPLKTVK